MTLPRRRFLHLVAAAAALPVLPRIARAQTKERIMPAANYLPEVLETTEAERAATGFIFTEGPLWHPDGYWYFVDIRQNKLFRMTPGKAARGGKERYPRGQRDDLRPARPSHPMRRRRPPCHAHGC